jgi:hypothetical protein
VADVNEALSVARSNGGKCMTAEQYDDYSTPNRDERLKDSFLDLEAAFKASGNGENLSATMQSDVNSVLNNSVGSSSDFCPIVIAPGKVISLGQVYTACINGKISSNPNDSLEYRWGLLPGHSQNAESCKSY